MSTTTSSKQECINNCQTCQTVLSDTFTTCCLTNGGAHVEKTHVKLMLDCIAACNACVGFMSRNSEFHSHYCSPCAEICKKCADSCQKIGGMDECVQACRDCQRSCAAMAG